VCHPCCRDRSFTDGRVFVRRGPLQAHGAGVGRRLLPLHPLPARTGTGSSAQARIDGSTFRLLKGEELVKAWRHPDGGFEKCFCRECGSHLFSRNPDDPAQMSVRLGAFDGDPGVRPSWRTYVAYAAPWEPIPDDRLERFAEGRPRF
jgi:hypothetical protein